MGWQDKLGCPKRQPDTITLSREVVERMVEALEIFANEYRVVATEALAALRAEIEGKG